MTARALIAVACLCAVAFGQDSVEDALERFEDATENDPGLSEETRRAMADLAKAIREDRERGLRDAVDAYLEDTTRDPARPDVLDKVKVYGDLRFREEYTAFTEARDRNRFRVRFRLGAEYAWNDEILLGTRLVVGDRGDPNTTHQSFGTVLDDYEIALDRLFLRWSPAAVEGGAVTVGKFDLKLARDQVYGELVWDGDVQPEGAMLTYACKCPDGGVQLDFTAAGIVLLERGGADDPFGLFGQASATIPVRDDLVVLAGASFSWWSDVDPAPIFADNAGNAVVDTDGDTVPDAYASGFGIANLVASATYTGWRWPLTASAEYFVNTRADIDGDTGWAIGIGAGRKGKKGDLFVYYQWQVVEQDAVFTVVSQDDFVFGSNYRGHAFGVKYWVWDQAEVHLWFLGHKLETAPPGAPTDLQWRIRLDLTLSF